MKIGDKIRVARKVKKITGVDLAKYIGISAPTLRKIENNQLFVTLELIKKIAKYPNIETTEEELKKYYCEQKLEKVVKIQNKGEAIFITIPNDVALGFNLDKNREVYICYLESKIILRHNDNNDYYFEKKKIYKDRTVYILFLQRLTKLNLKKVKLELDLKREILIVYLIKEKIIDI